MKVFCISILILISIVSCYGQNASFTDKRDNQQYSITSINDLEWMLDNLNYETSLSTGITSEQFQQYNLQGRYYHLSEIDSVCPNGWSLPNVDNWKAYFNYLVETSYPEVKLKMMTVEDPIHHTISEYHSKINLFDENNPLNLHPTGRIEGAIFNKPDVYADFWTLDNPEEAEGRTHIHIMNPWTTIHSHKHHLKVKQKKKLRKFMVRCVRAKS